MNPNERTLPQAPPAPAAQALHRLPVVGRFELTRLLGQGAVGAVYAARDHLAQRVVALKLLTLAGSDTESGAVAETRRRFLREAEVAQRLDHPDIVITFEAGCDGSMAWLAMELVPGVPLARYAAPSRLLPEPVVLAVVERAAMALAHAHQAGVVHRDVKPANVMVDWASNTVKLADFGLAHLAEGSSTGTGLLLGSPAYMAPELLGGAVPTRASDLYALGVSLFQLLTGVLPHDDGQLAELMRRRHAEPAPDVRELRPQLPPGLAALLREALARDPDERPTDLAGWGQALAQQRADWGG